MARASIHLSTSVAAAIDLDRDAGESLSGRISMIVERYQAIISAHRPELSRPEWMAICDVMNGEFLGMGDTTAPRYIWASVSDACRMDGLADKWHIDGQALVDKLRNLDYAGCIAAAEVGRRFWSAASGKDGDQALTLALDFGTPIRPPKVD